MARYWVGTGAWNASNTANWSDTSGGATGASIPTAADNVIFDASSGNCDISAGGRSCRSLDASTYTGALVFSSGGTATLAVGDSVPGPGNVAFRLSAAMTFTTGGGSFPSTITFASTSATAQTITTAGKTLGNVTFNGVGGKWTLQDALTCSGNFTVSGGYFNANAQNMTLAAFNGVVTTSTRTVDITNCSITLTSGGGTPWNMGYGLPVTGMTFIYAGSTLTFTGSLSYEFRGGGLTYNNVVFNMTTGSTPIQITAANTFNNLTFNGAAGTACNVVFTLNNIVTGTLTVTGNSATNRILFYSDVLGTPRVITAAAVSLTDVDFMDITIVGPVGSTITSDSFNRADGSLVGSTSDAAAGGTGVVWSAPFENGASWTVSSNEASFANSPANTLPIQTGVSDHYAEVTISTNSSDSMIGLVVRYASNFDFVNIQYTSAGSTLLVRAVHDGAVDSLGAPTISSLGGLTVGDVLGLGICGNAVVVYKNGVPVYSATIRDSWLAQIGSGTYAGMYATKGATNAKLDNFAVKNLAPVTGTRLGDCLGNSGIEFTTASGTARDGGGAGVKRYAVAAGNFSDTAMWSESSGGAPGASVPLPQDDVYLDANSAAGTYTINILRVCRNLDCTGFTRSLTPTSGTDIFGSVIIPATTNFPGTNTWTPTLRGRGNHILSIIPPIPFHSNLTMSFISPGGTYTLGATLDMRASNSTNNNLNFIAGTFNSANYNIHVGSFNMGPTNGQSPVINLGLSTCYIGYNPTLTPLYFGFTPVVNASTATFVVVKDSAGGVLSRTFQGGGKSYGALTYTVADSPGALTITGSNTFGTVNIGSGRSLKLTSGTTQKIGTLNLNGVPRGGFRLPGVSGSYLSAPDSAAVSVTGDIDIRVRVAVTDWTSVDHALVAKYGAAGQRSFRFYVDSLGRLNFSMSTDGTANTGLQWQAGPTFVDGTTYWVRTTRTAAGTLRFFYAADQPTMPTSWTEAGLSQTLSAGQNIFDSTSPVEIGSIMLGTAYLANGVFKRAQIRNNVLDDGSGIVFDTDFSNQFGPHYVDSSTNGAIVTPSTTLANVGDGRVVIESATAGSAATLQVDTVTGMNYVDLKDVVMNGADTYIEATSVIRSNVKGVRRGPQTGMSMMMGV